MTSDPSRTRPRDDGLRVMLKWVFVALGLTVLFALAAVTLTIRWLS